MFFRSISRAEASSAAAGKRLQPLCRQSFAPIRLRIEPLEPRLVLDGGPVGPGDVFPANDWEWTDLRVTEIMYRPAPPTVAEVQAGFTDNEGDDFEFIELQNTGVVAMNLGGVRFSVGVNYTFAANFMLPAGDYVVLARDPAGITSRHPGIESYAFVSGALSNGGERLRLEDPSGETIADFSYDNDWYDITRGDGYSLVILDPAGDLAAMSDAAAWRPSAEPGGSPGQEDPHVLAPGSVIINEVLAHTDEAVGDWIELHNTTDEAIDIGGWYLSDEDGDAEELKKYAIPAGTEIEAGEYLRLTQVADFGAAFALSELGEEAHLASAVQGTLSGYRDSVAFGASDRERTLGPHTLNSGEVEGKLVALASATPGAENSGPLIGDVVVSEIMYNPAGGGDEFIELYNRTSFPVVMYDPFHRANTWRISGVGVDGDDYFHLPPNTVLGSGAYALIVPIEPATFRQRYAISPGVPIFGPYPGGLQGSGESVVLSRPGDPEPQSGLVPYYNVDRVRYNDKLPWPTKPDGDGPALMRIELAGYGNEPENWGASADGGTPGAAQDLTPPTTPDSLTARAPNSTQIRLQWAPGSDAQSGISEYRIYRDAVFGDPPIGTVIGTTFTDNDVDLLELYRYEVSAVNGHGLEGERSDPLKARIMAITSVSVVDASHVKVAFSESIDNVDRADYLIAGTTIAAAELDPQDGRTVVLTTTPALLEDQTYTLTVRNVRGVEGEGGILPTATEQFLVDLLGPQEASIEGRYVFYNHSKFDGENAAATALDDAAIATDKQALLPGESASLENYTSYSLGINGIMVDVAQSAGPITARDFRFRVGNNQDPSTWQPGPQPSSVVVRSGAGASGSDRVTITWPDHAIVKQWVEVTVLSAGIGLPGNDVFYFGNAVAEAGNLPGNTQVTSTDLLLARNNPRNFLNPAGVEFPYDYNRDKFVSSTDLLLARNNQTNFLTALKLLDLSAGARAMPAETAWVTELALMPAEEQPSLKQDPAAAAVDQLLIDYWS